MTLTSLTDKRLIFTVTTGRSGTGYLAKVLSFVPGIASFHEPEPDFADIMRAAQTNPNLAYNFWIERKLPHIATVPANVYVETSHLFCKGFAQPLLDLGIVPDLIILTRPYREVALSLYRLDVIPGRTDKGLKYLLSPADPGVLALENWWSLHDYQLCYWYCLEISRRAEVYAKIFSGAGARVVSTALQELVNVNGFIRLLRELGLTMPRLSDWIQYLIYRGQPVNTKQKQKQQNDLSPEDIAYLESEILDLIDARG